MLHHWIKEPLSNSELTRNTRLAPPHPQSWPLYWGLPSSCHCWDLPKAPGGFLPTTPGTLIPPFPCTACKGSPQPQAAPVHRAGALKHHISHSLEQNNKTAIIKGKKINSISTKGERWLHCFENETFLFFLFQEIFSLSFTQTLSILECLERKKIQFCHL